MAVATRAYRGALAIGDMRLAIEAAHALTAAKKAPADTIVLGIASALAARDLTEADAVASSLGHGPLDFLEPSVRAWIAFVRSGARAAFEVLDAAPADGLGQRFVAENRALLLIAAGHRREGLDATRALLSGDTGVPDVRIAAASLLACGGAKKQVASLLTGADPTFARLRGARQRCARGKAAFGIGRLFVRLGAEVGSGETAPLAIVLARSALLLDPANDRARLVLADALSRGDFAPQALAVLDAVSHDSAFRGAAETLRIAVLDRGGRDADALAAAGGLAVAPEATSDDAQRYGDLLFASGRFADAADAYAVALTRTPRGPEWVLNLQRGSALERTGRWDEARPLLERAVALAPDEAAALNALGYGQAERGESLPAARALLERAAKLRPDDPSITDSLGWAYFRSGSTTQALPLLERAARARPESGEINEHLGDAYWTLGRRFEARYAWRAAALVVTSADASSRIAAKLAHGLR